MASQKSKRRPRKRRTPGTAPRAVTSPRRERLAERTVLADREQRRAQSTLASYGERPRSPFGGLPVSEIAILAGGVGVVVGLVQYLAGDGLGPALIVGVIVCALGVLEVTAREHFSGYRSHTTLLAALPAVAVGIALIALVRAIPRAALLAVVASLYSLLFWLLRKRFRAARQARIVRPPAP